MVDTDQASSNFLPGAFTSKENLIEIREPGFFENEQIIFTNWITQDDEVNSEQKEETKEQTQ